LSLPWTLTLAVFWVYPLGYALYLAFARHNVFSGSSEWIGFGNFAAVLGNAGFWSALGHTALFTAGTVPATTTIAILLALALNQRIRGRSIYRAGFFAPTLTATVVIALVFLHLYSQEGYLYRLAEWIGIAVPPQGFLLSESTALLSVMAMDVWVSVGYYALLFLAGLQTIPQELVEDALMHGANGWQRLYAIVINLIKSFQIFTEIFVMTQGGPVGSTTTAVYHIYTSGFERFDLGYASAAAYLLFAAIALVAAVQFKLLAFGRGAEE
jgi:multiple sugar transport system permease protein